MTVDRRVAVPPPRAASALAAPVAVAGVALAAVAVVAVLDPNEPGHYPTCPFLALTGQFCPGCGTLRAVHALVHGDPVAALDLNAVTVLTLPLLMLGWLRWVAHRVRGTARRHVAPAWSLYAAAVLLLVFWVVRNTPVGAPLAP